MKHYSLTVEKREVTGKKVKKLRKEGTLPINLFGKKIKSQSLKVATIEFSKIYDQAGTTGLIELTVKGTKESHPVLIHHVQVHPVTDTLLHADFHEVELKEKMFVEVPVHLEGESPAAAQHTGVLLQVMDRLEIEALPTEIPDEIIIDVSILKEINDEIKVGDIKVKGNYTIVSDRNALVVKINPLEKEEEPEPVAPAEGEAVESKEALSEEQKAEAPQE